MEVVVIDYGCGNLFSLEKALAHVGARVTISARPDILRNASAVILPGVGAFGDGMAELKKRGLSEPVVTYARNGGLLLGICLGMQILFDWSEEFGRHGGLGLVPGAVKRIPVDQKTCKIPQVGWNKLSPLRPGDWENTLLNGVRSSDEVYFVHSYAGYPRDKKYILAETNYCGISFPAVIMNGNVIGTQFHPEKSGEVGLSMLKNFLTMGV